MGRDGVMYLMINNPDVVDALGSVVPLASHVQAEEPPKPVEPNLKLVKKIQMLDLLATVTFSDHANPVTTNLCTRTKASILLQFKPIDGNNEESSPHLS